MEPKPCVTADVAPAAILYTLCQSLEAWRWLTRLLTLIRCAIWTSAINKYGDVMIDDEHRPRHWLYTLLLALGAVAIILLCVILLPFLVVELNTGTFFSFPFGYYLAAQGVMIGLIILVYWVAIRQEETDQKFGATEDL